MTAGIVFNIQRYSLQDGPGIRTTVFLKGCPAACPWCHNPESRSAEPMILLDEARCLHCGSCLEACPQSEPGSAQERAGEGALPCLRCGACVEACPAGARSLAGQSMSVAEVLREVLADRIFYDQSGGGVTFSGGEPFAQFAFLEALLAACREAGLHTAVDTCGYVPPAQIETAARLCDLFLYDLKIMDPARHRTVVGISNSIILENLRALARLGTALRIRIPIIPGTTDDPENIEELAEFIAALEVPPPVDLLPYHAIGMHKFERIGQTYQLGRLTPPGHTRMERLAERFRRRGLAVTIGG